MATYKYKSNDTNKEMGILEEEKEPDSIFDWSVGWEMLYKGGREKTRRSEGVNRVSFRCASGGKSTPLNLYNRTRFFYGSCAHVYTWPQIKLQK